MFFYPSISFELSLSPLLSAFKNYTPNFSENTHFLLTFSSIYNTI